MKMIKLEKYKDKFEVAYNLLHAYLENWKGEHNYFYYSTKNELQALIDVIEYFKTGRLELSPEQYNFIRDIAKAKHLKYGTYEYTFRNPAIDTRPENEYDKRVSDFLERRGITVSASKPTVVHKWNAYRNKYLVTWKRPGKKMSYTFFDSQHHYENNIPLELSSVVVPEIMDEPMSLSDFTDEMGGYTPEIVKTYKAVQNLVRKAMNFFTEEEREEMRGMEL